jgi:uncharacterized protein YigA (DUF484 family)
MPPDSDGQEPTQQATVVLEAPQAADVDGEETNQIKALRQEAARYRVQLRETQAQVKGLQDVAGNNEELAKRLAALEASLAEKTQAAERAAREAAVTRLAMKAGVDPDVVGLLDVSRIDLSNEPEALKTLAKLAPQNQTAGRQVRPGAATGNDDAALRERYFGSGKTNIFGG